MKTSLRPQQLIFSITILLVSFGLLMIYSASSVVAAESWGVGPYYYLIRQSIWAVGGIICLFTAWNLDYRRLDAPKWGYFAIIVTTLLLLVAYAVDTSTHRWLKLGVVNLQPSELAKPAAVVFLAMFLTRYTEQLNNLRVLFTALIAVGLMTGLILAADIGTAAVLMSTTAILFVVAGLRVRYAALAALIAVLSVAVAIAFKPYRLVRILHFVDPQLKLASYIVPRYQIEKYLRSSAAALDPGYQVRQSKIAIGSGGLTGLGLMQGRQKLFYLPAAHTDFILAVIGEELGFLGTSSVWVCFSLLFLAGLHIAIRAPDPFGRYLALGASFMIFLQALMNMAVVTGLAPTKGIPLPMLSYGGSSLLSTLTLVGLVLSVGERAR